MNIDRGQEHFTPEEISDLQGRLKTLKFAEGHTWRTVAQLTGVPEGTISQWVTGKYAGDNGAVAYKVNKFFQTEEARRELELQAPDIPGFQHTPTARRMQGQLRWAQRGKLNIIVGSAGMGKTSSIRQYCASATNAWVATMSPATRSPSTMIVEIMRSFGLTSRGGGSLQTLAHILCDRLADMRALLVLDEAQHLNNLALEMIRSVHDKIGVGVVLAGNPTVLSRIQGGAYQAEFAQLASRVSLSHFYDRPDPADIVVLAEAWGVSHPRERALLASIADRPGHLRNLTMTMELATFMARSQGEDRALEHIEQAWRQQSQKAS